MTDRENYRELEPRSKEVDVQYQVVHVKGIDMQDYWLIWGLVGLYEIETANPIRKGIS